MEWLETIIDKVPARDIVYVLVISGLFYLLIIRERWNRKAMNELCKELKESNLEARESNALLKQLFPIIIYRGPAGGNQGQNKDLD